MSELGKTVNGIGEGETVLKIINNNISNTSTHNEYDIQQYNNLWEVKKGSPIMSGGTNKQILNDFITVLILLDKINAIITISPAPN